MIFELAQDFRDTAAVMPQEHPKHRMLELLEEAIRRDIHFIDRHPTTLFQCMWNTCWWYGFRETGEPVTERTEAAAGTAPRAFVERYRFQRERLLAGWSWVRSLRPPDCDLGCGRRRVLEGHSGRILAAALIPGSSGLVSSGDDGTICLWDHSTQQMVRVLCERVSPACTLAVSLGGTHVAAGDISGSVSVYDLAMGSRVATTAVQSRIVCMGYTDEDELILAEEGGRLWTWKWRMGSSRCIIDAGAAAFRRAALSEDARTMVSTDASGKVAVWDTREQAHVAEFPAHDRATAGVAISDDDGVVCSVDPSGQLCVWHAGGTSCLASLQTKHKPAEGGPMCIVGSRLHVGCRDGVVETWDIGTKALVSTRQEHAGPVTWLASTCGGREIFSAGYDATIRVWEAEEVIRFVADHADAVTCMDGTGDGRLLISGARDSTTSLRRPRSGERCWQVKAHDGFVTAVTIASHASVAVTGGSDALVRIWATANGDCLHTIRAHRRGVCGLAISDDGSVVLSAGRDGRICVTRLSAEPATEEIDQKDTGISAVAICSGGEWGIVADEDGALCAYNLRATDRRFVEHDCGMPLVCLDAHTPGTVVAGTEQGTVVLWWIEQENAHHFEGHTAPVTAVLGDIDLGIAASGDMTGAVKVRSLYDGSLLGFPAPHGASIRGIVNAGVTGPCVCVDEHGDVSTWERRSLLEVCRFSCGQGVTCVAGSDRDPAWIACGTEAGNIRVFTVETAGGKRYASAH